MASTVDEIPVMPAGRVSKSHPEYFTVDLPFYQNFQMNLVSGENLKHQFIRLDSVYDPMSTGASSGISRQPLGRDSWATIYDFYRVISSDVHIKFTYTHAGFGTVHTAAIDAWNGDNPTHCLVGYAITDDTTDVAANPIAFVEMKHSKASYIHPREIVPHNYTGATATLPSKPMRVSAMGGTSSMSFHYNPNDWDYHVSNLGQSERWTPKDSVPDFSHFLGIALGYPNNNATLQTNEHIKIDVDLYINYKVQWREVNSTLKRTIDAS